MNESEYTPLEVIGHGSFGQIRRVQRKSDGQILVRKEISYKSMNQKERTQLISEFRILKSLDHPNIVKYLHHEHVAGTHEVHLYMEFCGGGDLAAVINRLRSQQQYAPEHEVWSVLTQLLLALYRCHYNRVAPGPSPLFADHNSASSGPATAQTYVLHRDIKPENVFLDSDHNVKLGDFGLAKLLDSDNPLANTYVGTPYYMSPEVLMDQPSTQASDIWSMGCVLYELCALHPPFQAKSHLQLSQRIREGVFEPIPSMYSSTLSRFITWCLKVNPTERPTCANLLNLDIVKVCHQERLLLERERLLVERERMVSQRETQLDVDKRKFKERLEREVYNSLEDDLEAAIDAAVEERLEKALRARNLRSESSHSLPPSSPTPSSDGTRVRGPRSVQEKMLSPLRRPLNDFNQLPSKS